MKNMEMTNRDKREYLYSLNLFKLLQLNYSLSKRSLVLKNNAHNIIEK